MDRTTLFSIVLIGLILGAIMVMIVLAKTFAKTPTISIVQGKLENEESDDIEEAVNYLKIVNKEWEKRRTLFSFLNIW